MVRIEKYHPYKKNGFIYTYGEEISCCPDCGRKMYVHGTCRRKVRTFEDPDVRNYIDLAGPYMQKLPQNPQGIA